MQFSVCQVCSTCVVSMCTVHVHMWAGVVPICIVNDTCCLCTYCVHGYVGGCYIHVYLLGGVLCVCAGVCAVYIMHTDM